MLLLPIQSDSCGYAIVFCTTTDVSDIVAFRRFKTGLVGPIVWTMLIRFGLGLRVRLDSDANAKMSTGILKLSSLMGKQ